MEKRIPEPGSAEGTAVPAKIHPLMPPDELKALWRSVRKRWRHDGEAMVREIEAERDAWDDEPSPGAH